MNVLFEKIDFKAVNKDVFLREKAVMQKSNIEMCKFLSIVGAVFFWLLSVASLYFTKGITVPPLVFVVTASALTVYAILMFCLKKLRKKPRIALYSLVFCLSVFISVLTTFYSPNNVSGIYVGVCILFAVIIYDLPWRVCVFTIIINLIFVVMSFCAKDFNIAILDAINIAISTLMGHFLFRFSMNTRLNTIIGK